MSKTNKSKFAILGMLSYAPKSSGYDLKKLMEGSTQYFWKESYGAIYPVLESLVEEGLIKQHREGSNTKSARQKNLYELTPEGKKALNEWINKPIEYEQPRNELLLKVFFGEFSPASTTQKHIEEFYQMLQAKDKYFTEIRQKLISENKNDSGLPYWLMTLEYGMMQVKTAIQWCEKALKQFGN